MITILADDLSGTQEAVAAAAGLPDVLRDEVPPAVVRLTALPGSPRTSPEVLGLDLDCRHLAASEVRSTVRAALDDVRSSGRADGTVFHKLDSLLRGPLEAHLGVAAEHGPVVFCPAVPALGRTVVDGVVHVQGRPLHRTDLWAAEPLAVPASILDGLGSLLSARVDLASVRAADLRSRLARAARDVQVVVCDAEDESDLDAVAASAVDLQLGLAGAAGLAAAAGRAHRFGSVAVPAPREDPGILFVIGTASRAARAQVERLAAQGVTVRSLTDVTVHDRGAHDLVLTVPGPLDPGRAAQIDSELAAAVTVVRGRRDLFLTGGQTARRILDSVGATILRPLQEPEHGLVIALADDDSLIATRPGSFGGPDSLLSARHAMHALHASDERTPT